MKALEPFEVKQRMASLFFCDAAAGDESSNKFPTPLLWELAVMMMQNIFYGSFVLLCTTLAVVLGRTVVCCVPHIVPILLGERVRLMWRHRGVINFTQCISDTCLKFVWCLYSSILSHIRYPRGNINQIGSIWLLIYETVIGGSGLRGIRNFYPHVLVSSALATWEYKSS